MKRFTFSSLLLLAFVFTTNAQSKKVQDKNAIKKMCGCYEVTFNFAETFQYSKDSLYKPSKTKVASALEWAQLIEDDKNKVSIQHLLQVGDPSKPHIVKHWRQDWIYQNTNFYMFNGNNSWNYESKSASEVKGQWTQKVYQVDDSPRYEGSATWVHVDGKSFWENRTDAPLPRREYTKRSDYNVTVRGNRHEITKNGWVHDQNNDKVIREAGKADVILAKEKGYNTYVKVDDSKCKAAANWWKENNQKWALVRNKWENVYGRNADLVLEAKVDNKPLYKHLFSDENIKEKDINKVIESFVIK
ncbi:hypothetical protein ATE84_1266 [Aquimarina sp. MAR_2010_214]|uniref:DUF6607 family protein n=1 Tax=Aquimarina sp. MAR_2010_214 TaxID=1250026 RepID=UPI000C71543E|nr:DUF6607 family protein [Aquimarina sp. MAR_2010_214]PKV49246.1 hypothetical protein ATE84_1266 [Aquimarina sp. MAR_2010_214]